MSVHGQRGESGAGACKARRQWSVQHPMLRPWPMGGMAPPHGAEARAVARGLGPHAVGEGGHGSDLQK